MVHKILFWTGFGLFVRVWQLGIQMRPLFARGSLLGYPIFGTIGGGFGFWLQGVENQQQKTLDAQKKRLLEKREKRAAAQGRTTSTA